MGSYNSEHPQCYKKNDTSQKSPDYRTNNAKLRLVGVASTSKPAHHSLELKLSSEQMKGIQGCTPGVAFVCPKFAPHE